MGNSLYLTKNPRVFLGIELGINKNLFDINNALVIKCMYGVSDASTFGKSNKGAGVIEKKPL